MRADAPRLGERELPWRWAICPTCQGRGHHSLHLGAITEEQRRTEWAEWEWDAYVRGEYDQPCDCDHGKVREVDAGRCSREDLRAWRQQEDEEEQDRRTQLREMGVWGSL